MRIIKLLSSALVAAGVLAATGTASPSASFQVPASVVLGSKASLDAKVAIFPVTVSCSLKTQTDGSVTVTLSEGSGSKSASGTGSTPIQCDGIQHIYRVEVQASVGRFHGGSATVASAAQADGTETVTDCSTEPVVICVTGDVPATASGTAGPVTVTIENS